MLPEALRKQAEAVEAHFNKNTDNDAALDKETSNAGETPTEQPKAEPQALPTDNVNIDWQQRYTVLDGKYKAEVPKLSQEIRQLKDQINQLSATPQNDAQISQLQQEIDSLKQANQLLEQQQSQAAGSAIELNEHLTNEYGEDFAQSVAQVAQQISTKENQTLRQELDALKTQVSSTQDTFTQATQQTKFTELESLLLSQGITFSAVDSDPLFHEYLRQVDPRSGQSNFDMMSQAFSNGDLKRTALFYSDFSNTQSGSQAPNLNDYADNLNTVGQADTPQGRPQINPQAFTELTNQMMRKQITREEFERRERELFAQMAQSRR